MRLATVCALPLAFFVVGCGGNGRFVQKGINQYHSGDYASAEETWKTIAAEHADLNDKGELRYLVFRGMTHYRRGERAEAKDYLSRGDATYRKSPQTWLPTEDAQAMHLALADLNGPGTTTSSVAMITAPPPPLSTPVAPGIAPTANVAPGVVPPAAAPMPPRASH